MKTAKEISDEWAEELIKRIRTSFKRGDKALAKWLCEDSGSRLDLLVALDHHLSSQVRKEVLSASSEAVAKVKKEYDSLE